jgi:ferredoxin
MPTQTHFRDPCIHCGQPMECVAVGACPGDPKKAVVIAYRSLGTRWDGYEHFLLRLSTNEVKERWCHISEHAAYRGFKWDGDYQQPPRYDAKLALA